MIFLRGSWQGTCSARLGYLQLCLGNSSVGNLGCCCFCWAGITWVQTWTNQLIWDSLGCCLGAVFTSCPIDSYVIIPFGMCFKSKGGITDVWTFHAISAAVGVQRGICRDLSSTTGSQSHWAIDQCCSEQARNLRNTPQTKDFWSQVKSR